MTNTEPTEGRKRITFTRPLVAVWTALSVTPFRSEDEVIEAIEDGRLRWAWNLSLGESGKRMVRILGQSVSDLIEGSPRPNILPDVELQEVLKLIFPASKAVLSPAEIGRAWNCSPYHASKLRQRGLLRGACKTAGGLIEFKSAVEFLQNRRLN